ENAAKHAVTARFVADDDLAYLALHPVEIVFELGGLSLDVAHGISYRSAVAMWKSEALRYRNIKPCACQVSTQLHGECSSKNRLLSFERKAVLCSWREPLAGLNAPERRE